MTADDDLQLLDKAAPFRDQIVHIVRTSIESGRFRVGEPLPSTRELASRWGVSVWTVTEAMKQLATEDYIENKSGSMRIVKNRHAIPVDSVAELANMTVLIGGYAGSGKSELGRIIAKRIRAALLDKDTITQPLTEALLEELGQESSDRESQTYLSRVRPAEYQALYDAIIENASCGVTTIATAPFIAEFRDRDWLEATRNRLAEFGVGLAVVWVRCDARTMLSYLRLRNASRDAGKLSSWESYLAGIDLDYEPVSAHFVVDNSLGGEPLGVQATALLREIAR